MDDPRGTSALTDDGQMLDKKSIRERTVEKSEEKKKGELFELAWDKLVISVGCYNQTFNTPGVREHSLFLKDVGDARKIRNRLLSCMLELCLANPECADIDVTHPQALKRLLYPRHPTRCGRIF